MKLLRHSALLFGFAFVVIRNGTNGFTEHSRLLQSPGNILCKAVRRSKMKIISNMTINNISKPFTTTFPDTLDSSASEILKQLNHGGPILAVIEHIQMFYLNFLSENFAIFIVTTIGALLLSSKFVSRPRRKKLPPLSDTGMIETIRILMEGKNAPNFYLSTMKVKGPVYRLPIPEISRWIVVCDPALARKILIEEVEKPAIYRRFSGLISSSDSIFSASTHSHSWQSARKGLAPSFSMTNICLSLPKMYQKIDDLLHILALYESERKIVDLPELMTQLAMDFICAGKSSIF